jgi:hypothetical protein
MTSATPAPAASGATATTAQVDANTSATEYARLNSQATNSLATPRRSRDSRYLRLDRSLLVLLIRPDLAGRPLRDMRGADRLMRTA